LVEVLQGRYKLALLSNAPSSFFRTLLAKNALEQYFDEIVVSSEVGSVKPSLEIFHLTLERLKAKPDEAIFIDDNPKHVEAGERAGIRSLLFTSVEQLAKDLANLGIIQV
jgi:2-haloacid dehalogenase